MASLCGKIALNTINRNVGMSVARYCKMMPDIMEHATGIEKRELQAIAAGNDDPFDMKVIKRNAGTQQEPNLIPSAFESRIVGCICEEDATAVKWMWLHQNSPRRCECGHWFKLVQKAPV
ncbi:cytochrome c oxidase subunit 5B, mitochondrial-like [Ctenocephalides felis]|uniref:cytochrome c oxidase subunit 5B, mitochondrial-like n=1 Tax=Ctenocephalides felis TaxID=7515 RepID=UPI000E6E5943|nr:cytochrome c oxidase subunit 5B, mitochondrial-like [Ctenocephalides felis]